MGATVFVQPLDLVKNRMQLSGKQTLFTLKSDPVLLFYNIGEGGAVRQHKTSLHAIGRVISEEGLLGLYNGSVHLLLVCIVMKVCACPIVCQRDFFDKLLTVQHALVSTSHCSTSFLGKNTIHVCCVRCLLL